MVFQILLTQFFNLLSCVYIKNSIIFKLHFGRTTFFIYLTMLTPLAHYVRNGFMQMTLLLHLVGILITHFVYFLISKIQHVVRWNFVMSQCILIGG